MTNPSECSRPQYTVGGTTLRDSFTPPQKIGRCRRCRRGLPPTLLIYLIPHQIPKKLTMLDSNGAFLTTGNHHLHTNSKTSTSSMYVCNNEHSPDPYLVDNRVRVSSLGLFFFRDDSLRQVGIVSRVIR